LELICECRNGRETVDAIHRHRPDLVFLDVQMPGKTGFDVICAIADAQRPHVVFVTAYDKFALRAFEVHALDYLLKPVNEERFDAAVARVREAMSHATDNAIVQRVSKWPRICRWPLRHRWSRPWIAFRSRSTDE
jgi:two-component system, LytTR family, response regulator